MLSLRFHSGPGEESNLPPAHDESGRLRHPLRVSGTWLLAGRSRYYSLGTDPAKGTERGEPDPRATSGGFFPCPLGSHWVHLRRSDPATYLVRTWAEKTRRASVQRRSRRGCPSVPLQVRGSSGHVLPGYPLVTYQRDGRLFCLSAARHAAGLARRLLVRPAGTGIDRDGPPISPLARRLGRATSVPGLTRGTANRNAYRGFHNTPCGVSACRSPTCSCNPLPSDAAAAGAYTGADPCGPC